MVNEFVYLPMYLEDILFEAFGFWINPVVIFAVLVPLTLLQLVLTITAAWSLMKKPVPANDKLLWLVLICLINLIGPILYFAIGSGKLDDKAAQLEQGYEK